MKSVLTKLLALLLFAPASFAQKSIPEGSRVYIAPMGGFETNLIAAINNKKVPVVIVGSRASFLRHSRRLRGADDRLDLRKDWHYARGSPRVVTISPNASMGIDSLEPRDASGVTTDSLTFARGLALNAASSSGGT